MWGDPIGAYATRALHPDGTLRRLQIIERSDGNAPVPEARQTWAVTRRVLELLSGQDGVDSTFRAIVHETSPALPLAALAMREGAGDEALRATRSGTGVVIASGAVGTGRRSLLHAAALANGHTPLTIDARSLPSEPDHLRRELRAIARECRLHARTPLLTNLDGLADPACNRLDVTSKELCPLIDGLILATCGVTKPAMTWDRPVVTIDVGQPTSKQRATLWGAALGQGTSEDADHLATMYPLAPALIHHAASAAKARAASNPLEPDDIYAGIRSVLDDRLGQYARRLTVTQTWDDIVLPQDQVNSIVELLSRIRRRRTVYEQWGFAAKIGKGLGVSALFSGPPGTGKTMVAGLIANDLGLELYQVDVSRVVSKWLGETEKNLAAVFDAAEAGHAILLFDEADSLFGKRTDVKSSNDRSANLETNFLLQRLESFTGICLLTSNHETAIDQAFQRRLSLVLRFELPEATERSQLWRAMLPVAAPIATGVDFGALGARFAMSGGSIRNAALRAAFLAADEGEAITAAHLEYAARVEYEGMGKIAS